MFSNYNKKQGEAIRELISKVALTSIDTAKQVSCSPLPSSLASCPKRCAAWLSLIACMQKTYYGPTNGFRIDKQGNEVIKRVGGDFVQLAVQAGDRVYASAIVPFKQRITGGQVRKCLYASLEEAKVISFDKPPPSYKGVYTWLIITASTIALLL